MSGDPPDIAGSAEGLAGVASSWRGAADNVLTVQSQIAQHGLDSWLGGSGGAFRSKLGDFHPHLGTVNQSLESAGQRIASFAAALDGYQSSAGSYKQQLTDRRQSLSDARSQQSDTSQKLSMAQAQHAASSDPVTAAHHKSRIDDLGSMLDDIGRGISDLEHDIAGLVNAFWDLFHQYVRDVEDCARVVSGAAEGVAAILVGPAARALTTIAGEGVLGLIHGAEGELKRVSHDVEHGVRDAAHDAIQELDTHWAGIREGLEITTMAIGVVVGAALLVTGVGAALGGPLAAFAIGGLTSALVSDAVAGGDEFVARSGNTDWTTRKFAQEHETGDLIGAAVGTVFAVAGGLGALGGLSRVGEDLSDPVGAAEGFAGHHSGNIGVEIGQVIKDGSSKEQVVVNTLNEADKELVTDHFIQAPIADRLTKWSQDGALSKAWRAAIMPVSNESQTLIIPLPSPQALSV